MRRFSLYLRLVEDCVRAGVASVSSRKLAEAGGTTPEQARYDLSWFDAPGIRGHGYDPELLRRRLARMLGVDRRWSVYIVGAGRLGLALATYDGFRDRGFDVTGIFDISPALIGRKVESHRIRHVNELLEFAAVDTPSIGVITTSEDAAEDTARLLVQARVRGILNYTAVALSVQMAVEVRQVSIELELMGLSFALHHQNDVVVDR